MSTRRSGSSAAAAAARLWTSRDDGSLDALCARHGLGLLVVFGSVAVGADEPGDVDLAHLPGAGTQPLILLDDLAESLGDERIDLVNLATAGPVVSHRALSGVGLYEDDPGRFARMRDRAARQFFDTAWIRDVQAQVLAR